jgi:flagellar motor switch protein FliM
MAQQVKSDLRDKLLDAAGLALDQLPMLQVIFDRVATYCAESLRHIAASQPYYSLSNVETGRIGDLLEMYEGNALAGIFNVPEWDNHVIVGFDRDFVFSLIEIMFGSDGSEPPIEEGRGFSNIEIHVAHAVFEHVARALQMSFSLVADAQFKFERSESRMDFAVIGRRNNLAIAAKFLLQAINRGGEMFVIMPQSALTPLRQSLARVISGESTARDPAWTKQMRQEIQRTGVTIRAVLEEDDYDLAKIADLKVGQILKLQSTPRSRIKLESNHQPLFWCHLGQSEGFYTVRIDEMFDRDEEFINNVLKPR